MPESPFSQAVFALRQAKSQKIKRKKGDFGRRPAAGFAAAG
jgi:hypothetical protein